MSKKPSPIEQLMTGMAICAAARAEANWTNGYRTGRPDEEARMWPRELKEWERVEIAEARFRRLAQRLLREARRAGRGEGAGHDKAG